MLKSFVAWLDAYLNDEGPSAVVKAVVGMLGFAALVGALLGSTAVRAGALIVVLFLVLAVMLLLLRDRRRITRESESYRRLLARYCTFIADSPKPVARVTLWKQVAVLQPNGDTREIITIHAVVLREELYFLRLRFGANWKQPSRYQKRVTINVRSLLVDGSRGASWEVTPSWPEEGQLEMLAHLHSPAHNGSELRLQLEWNWPGKCFPLMRERGWDDFTFLFSQLMPTDYARYEVVLPHGADAYYAPIGFLESNGEYSIGTQQTSEGKIAFYFEGKIFPANQDIGMRLELKQNSSPIQPIQ